MTYDEELQVLLKSDRQWTHPCRVGHAQRQLQLVTTPHEKKLWGDVLKALEIKTKEKA